MSTRVLAVRDAVRHTPQSPNQHGATGDTITVANAAVQRAQHSQVYRAEMQRQARAQIAMQQELTATKVTPMSQQSIHKYNVQSKRYNKVIGASAGVVGLT
jgi:hypothetical protein